MPLEQHSETDTKTEVESSSEVFARRMRRYRKRRGWTQGDLAAELADIGWKVDRTQLAKIETGSRGIALHEAILIARALGLPPALLYLPLGETLSKLISDMEATIPASREWVRQ